MEYVTVVLILAGVLEYRRRERAHRRALALLRSGRDPAVRRPGTVLPLAAALAVLMVSIPLGAGLVHDDWLTRGLGAALLPVVAALAVMAGRRREGAR